MVLMMPFVIGTLSTLQIRAHQARSHDGATAAMSSGSTSDRHSAMALGSAAVRTTITTVSIRKTSARATKEKTPTSSLCSPADTVLHQAPEKTQHQKQVQIEDLHLQLQDIVNIVNSVPGMLQHLHKFKLHMQPGNPHQLLIGCLCLMISVLNVVMQQPTTTIVSIAMQQSIGSLPLMKLGHS
jgi:hypothetical protein